MASEGINFDKISVELLNEETYDSSFKCDKDDELGLDDFYHNEALSYQNERLGVTHQFRYDKRVIGFVTLAMTKIERDAIPKEDQLSIQIRNYPALLIGRLATHNCYRCQGIGTYLCKWSIGFAIDASLKMGCRYVLLETIEARKKWYEGREFKILDSHKGQSNTFWMYRKIDI